MMETFETNNEKICSQNWALYIQCYVCGILIYPAQHAWQNPLSAGLILKMHGSRRSHSVEVCWRPNWR